MSAMFASEVGMKETQCADPSAEKKKRPRTVWIREEAAAKSSCHITRLLEESCRMLINQLVFGAEAGSESVAPKNGVKISWLSDWCCFCKRVYPESSDVDAKASVREETASAHEKFSSLRVRVHAVGALGSAGMKRLCAERKGAARVSCCHDNNNLTRAAVWSTLLCCCYCLF